MDYYRLRCTLCQNYDQNAFVLDHQHGTAICTICGAECQDFQMMKASYKDYETHNLRHCNDLNTSKGNQAYGASLQEKVRSEDFHCVGFVGASAPAPVATTKFKSIGRVAEIRGILEYLCHYFQHSSPERSVASAIALYERNSYIYETKYVAKKEVWAAACYSVDAEFRKSKFSYKELAAAFQDDCYRVAHVEPKRISRIAGYIKKHERIRRGVKAIERDIGYSEMNGNLAAVSRLATLFGMNFRQEKIARKIVAFIDEEELILGLNPLSILSVSFFLALSLSAKTRDFGGDTPSFVKRTLRNVSQKIHIAQNTIRKGIRDVKEDVLEMIKVERKRLRINRQTIEAVYDWEL